VTLRYCSDCRGHHGSGYSCPQPEARRYRTSAARRARGRHAGRLAREAARRRDGNHCRGCGSSKALAVHHVVSLADGGEKYALTNLITLCRHCHAKRHQGDRGSTGNDPALPRTSLSRETPQPRPRFSRSSLTNVRPDDEPPLVG
jgi:5-methylcytosine-specific restriction endonuclease McrA